MHIALRSHNEAGTSSSERPNLLAEISLPCISQPSAHGQVESSAIRKKFQEAKAYVAHWQRQKQEMAGEHHECFIYEQLKGRDGKDLGRLYGLGQMAEQGDWHGTITDDLDLEDLYEQFEDPAACTSVEQQQALVDRLGQEHWRRLQGMSRMEAMLHYVRLVDTIMKEQRKGHKHHVRSQFT